MLLLLTNAASLGVPAAFGVPLTDRTPFAPPAPALAVLLAPAEEEAEAEAAAEVVMTAEPEVETPMAPAA